MTLRSCWRALVHGTWTQNRLTSRKFWVVLAFYAGTFPFAWFMAHIGMGESSVIETGINAVRDVVIAWLAVQGVVDIGKHIGGGGPGSEV